MSINYFSRYFCISISALLRRLSSLGRQKYYLDPNIMEFSFFLFKQMQLFPLIPSILTKISILVPGIGILLIVHRKEAEAGGMAEVVNVLFLRISTEFIRIVEMKPGPISIG